MISHERAQELISARMDVPLTPAEHRELQGHLATCFECRAFARHVDDMMYGLQSLPRLGASPAVSRAVMDAIATETGGWTWLRHALQMLSSPRMAVASSMALVLALTGALVVALNGPGSDPNLGRSAQPEGTIAAVAVAPLPTEVPTQPAQLEVTRPPVETPEPAPSATRNPGRTIAPAATRAPAKTPTPPPTATAVPIVEAAPPRAEPAVDSPPIEPVVTDEPVYEAPPAEDPALAMATDQTTDSSGSAELAQQAVAEEPVVDEQPAVVEEPVEQVAVEEPAAVEPTAAVEESAAGSDAGGDKEGKKNSREAVAEPEPTRPVGPVPIEAIAALEGAGNAPDFNLPPAPLDPLPPDQSFLPVTPTPVGTGTPTPETTEPVTESQAPQLAQDPSGELGIAALAPEISMEAEAPPASSVESEEIKKREKRDKSNKSGDSHESQQAAYTEQQPMGWMSEPAQMYETIELQQTADYPVESSATSGAETEYPVAASSTSGDTTSPDAITATESPERQIDPATGMEIDPATGYLIDPTTGYLLDRVNGRIIDPRTSYEVHPMTGLLIDPATGALLDPNTLAVVVPPGFGNDQPAYNPGSPEMRGTIQTVVDDTYNNASIRVEPPTDGPVQPVGEIVIPTESGEALEIS